MASCMLCLYTMQTDVFCRDDVRVRSRSFLSLFATEMNE